MARPPDDNSGHYGPHDQAKLRRQTARELIYSVANRHGELRHVRLKKDEATRTLRVTLWWNPGQEEHIARSASELKPALEAWVWDGWKLEMKASEEPAPDLLWDPYAEKFVPRKAYRPLGDPGRVKRRA